MISGVYMNLMFVVATDKKKVNLIVSKLKELGAKGSTIVNTQGSRGYTEFSFDSALRMKYNMGDFNQNIVYNKTVISLIHDEDILLKAMDEIEEILGGNLKKPGRGIIFSVPVLKFDGGALGKFLNNK